MPIPDFQTAMLPVLRAFAEGAVSVADVLPSLRAQFQISEAEAEQLVPSGRMTVLQSRAHWARTYLSKAGLLASPRRNMHQITDAGRALLASGVTRIDMTTLERFPTYIAWQEASRGNAQTGTLTADTPSADHQTPEERIETDFRAVEDALADDLLRAVLNVSPERFEQLIVDLLIAMGYGGGDATMGERLGRSGDGGIDGVINEDALGLDAVYIQAKRYAPETKVGRPTLQAFVGSLTGEGATKGVLVTTSDFSREAHDYLNKVQHRIVLINGQRLAQLMIQHEVGVRTRKTLRLRSIDEDYFAEPDGA